MTTIIDSFDSMTIDSTDSINSKIPDLVPLSRDYLREDELFDIPDGLEDCHQVAQVVLPNSIMEIYYNDVLKAPFVHIHDEWIYFGNSDTTFRELFTRFGITEPVITWIEPLYDINEVYLNDAISLSPAMILEMGEDYDGCYGEDDNY